MVKNKNINKREKEIFNIDLDIEEEFEKEGYIEAYEINLNKLDELSEVEIEALDTLSIILDILKL